MLIRRISISLAVVVVCLALVVSVSAEPNFANVYTGNIGKRPLKFVPGRVLVKFKETVTDEEAEQIVRGLGARIEARALKRAFRVVSVPKGQVMKKVEALRRNPRVRYAHPDLIAYADFVPTDGCYPLQWHLDNPVYGGIEMEQAWDISGGGSSTVVVAVLDSGIAYETDGIYCRAPDLEGATFAAGWDFINNDAHPNDDFGHGTHVAGTIAQTTNNSITVGSSCDPGGVAGIAFNTTIMPVKVLDANGQGPISIIAEGIRWAADHGAQIINMSLGTPGPAWLLGALADAVQYAHGKGVVIVASSGNSSGATPHYPAAYPEVIAVGATTYDEKLASYSNRGNELCAPGGFDQDLNGDGVPDMVLQNTFFDPDNSKSVADTVCDFKYWFFSGTSMAAPHVSGLAALMLSVDSTLTNEDIRTILHDTADPVESACGHGLINAHEALWTVANSDDPPSVNIKYPSSGDFISGPITVNINATDDNDAAGALTVEWNVDGGVWKPTTYNSVHGLYESEKWDTREVIDGQHFINARATDSLGNESTVSSSVLVNNVNDPPIVSFTYTCSGFTCDFDASDSYDPDGTIQSYDWSFGDGTQSEPASGATVRHTYAASGKYPVSVTVTDDGDASNSYSEDVSVTEGPPTLHIEDLDAVGQRIYGRFWLAKITLTVQDSWYDPVIGATVYGVFDDGGTLFNCKTQSDGICSVQGYQYFRKCLTYTVLDISHPDYVYDPAQNRDVEGDSDGTNITVCRP